MRACAAALTRQLLMFSRARQCSRESDLNESRLMLRRILEERIFKCNLTLRPQPLFVNAENPE